MKDRYHEEQGSPLWLLVPTHQPVWRALRPAGGHPSQRM